MPRGHAGWKENYLGLSYVRMGFPVAGMEFSGLSCFRPSSYSSLVGESFIRSTYASCYSLYNEISEWLTLRCLE